MPQVVSIAVLVNPGNPVSAAEGRDVQGRAAALGVAIHVQRRARTISSRPSPPSRRAERARCWSPTIPS